MAKVAKQDTMRLQSFDLATQNIADASIEALHALSVGVGWPHRPSDWAFLRTLGQGFAAIDEIGRVFNSAMWFDHGESCATIGMVITSPRVQTRGGGRWMMDRVLQECGERRLILNSTHSAYTLYMSLGFEFQAVVQQVQGVVGISRGLGPSEAGRAETMSLSDLPEIIALDTAAFGADRTAILSRIAPLSQIVGLRRKARLEGYAMRRSFGRGHVIGPVIATSEEDAVRLVAPLLSDLGGQFARIDTWQQEGPLRAFLHAAGLKLHGTAKTLSRGTTVKMPRNEHPGIYGLAAQPLG